MCLIVRHVYTLLCMKPNLKEGWVMNDLKESDSECAVYYYAEDSQTCYNVSKP